VRTGSPDPAAPAPQAPPARPASAPAILRTEACDPYRSRPGGPKCSTARPVRDGTVRQKRVPGLRATVHSRTSHISMKCAKTCLGSCCVFGAGAALPLCLARTGDERCGHDPCAFASNSAYGPGAFVRSLLSCANGSARLAPISASSAKPVRGSAPACGGVLDAAERTNNYFFFPPPTRPARCPGVVPRPCFDCKTGLLSGLAADDEGRTGANYYASPAGTGRLPSTASDGPSEEMLFPQLFGRRVVPFASVCAAPDARSCLTFFLLFFSFLLPLL